MSEEIIQMESVVDVSVSTRLVIQMIQLIQDLLDSIVMTLNPMMIVFCKTKRTYSIQDQTGKRGPLE